ncbi:MAG: hypothetical protein P1U89_04980 [Verrucomicrobiales bacterium]|nr:hypothetical protein [Verrucomicrobiales bacterium]
MDRVYLLTAAVFTAFSATLLAQLPVSELHSLNPPVVVSGTTTDISLTGVNLDEADQLLFSDPGISAEPIMLPKTEFHLSQRQHANRFKLTIPEVKVEKTVSLRAAGYFGLSTSRPLTILPAGAKVLSDKAGAAHHKLPTAPDLDLNTVAYGTTDAKQTDWWRLSLQKGERILVHCRAERIDSQADAVLAIVDSSGLELERNRDAIGRDPMLDFTAPDNGNYWVGVHDTFYTGGANFCYLLEASTRPWIDAVYPPAGKAGETFEATLLGRNLPGGSLGDDLSIDGKPIESVTVKITVPAEAPGREFSSDLPARAALPAFSYRYKESNPVRVGIAREPLLTGAKNPVPPFSLAGRFDTPGEVDEIRFRAEKGVEYWVEVVADRIAGFLDPYLIVEKVVVDKEGQESFKMIKQGDDNPNTAGATFLNSSRDYSMNFKADEAADYRISVLDQYRSAGPEKNYWVSLRKAKPDFEVLAIAERPYHDQRQAYPAAPLLRRGGTVPLRIAVNRIEGFSDPITIQANELPEGVTCPPLTLNSGQNTGTLVFTSAPDAPAFSGGIDVIATAKSGDVELSRPVNLGSLVLGIPDYNTARLRPRLDIDFPLAVSGSESSPVKIEVGNENKFSVEIGKKLEIPVKLVNRNGLKGNLTITPVELKGMSKPPTLAISDKDTEGKLKLDFTPKNNVFTPQVGTWSFVLKGTGVMSYQRNPAAAEKLAKEKKHVEDLSKKYIALAAKTKAEEAAKKKSFEQSTANVATASVDARAGLEKAAADARVAYDEAVKATATAEKSRLSAEREKAAIVKRHSAAVAAAKAKDVKIAVWSLPISIEIKPAPQKKK